MRVSSCTTSPILIPIRYCMRRSGLDCRIALCHCGLNCNRTFDGIHNTGELGKNAITSRINDAPAELADHWKHNCLMVFEVAHRARLIRTHQSAVTSNVSSQNGGEPARLTVKGGVVRFHGREVTITLLRQVSLGRWWLQDIARRAKPKWQFPRFCWEAAKG